VTGCYFIIDVLLLWHMIVKDTTTTPPIHA